jgi:hypothetical protein
VAKGWDAQALAARFRENPDVGIHTATIGNLTNSVTTQQVIARSIKSEHDLQAAAFEEFAKLALVYPEYRLIHPIPNGQYRAGQRPEAGLHFGKGYPDIAWDLPRRHEAGTGIYFGLRCELKFGKNKPSDDQVWWAEQLAKLGYLVVTIWDDLDRVVNEFRWYYNLRKV